MANTCSPSHDQLHLTGTPVQNLADIEAIYNLIFPWTLCPPALFFSLIRINQLRAQVSASLFSREIDPRHSLEAHSLLTTIEDFSPSYVVCLFVPHCYRSSVVNSKSGDPSRVEIEIPVISRIRASRFTLLSRCTQFES
jgi:hypothetical protein